MKYLIDTHAFLWFNEDDPALRPSAKRIILDPTSEIYLSIASPWEVAIKVATKKLTLNADYLVYVNREIARNRYTILRINFDHLSVVSALPHHHRDPFDRLLIAQSLVEGMPILSADAAFDPYGVVRLW